MKQALILLSQDETGQIVLEDATGKVYALGSGQDAASVLRRILDDPDLPKTNHTPGNVASVEDAVSKMFESSVPEAFRPLATLGVSAFMTRVQKISNARINGRARKAGKR